MHISDWKIPTTSLNDRTILKDSFIPVKDIIKKIIKAGYKGYFEYEVLSENYNKNQYFSLLNEIIESYKINIEDLL